MKDCCERDESSSRVTVGTGAQKALVEKFRGKFIREAQMIAGMDHRNIVRVIDVFEENGTAYYVMDNLHGGSLADKVKREGKLSEKQAENYIRQVAGALEYIHSRNTVHLDVKPSNILLNAKGEAVLIDFGISKHYDTVGEQTSSTPVGVSKGYAPHEQGRDGDVSQFGPPTDIYALGATLYNLLTGQTPPESSIILDEGLDRPRGVSNRMWAVIERSMQPKRKDRPQSIREFLSLMDKLAANKDSVEDDETVVVGRGTDEVSKHNNQSKPKNNKGWVWALAGCAAAAVIIALILKPKPKVGPVDEDVFADTTAVAVTAPVSQQGPIREAEPVKEPGPETPGSIKVSSTPSGAAIWLDGKNTKKTTPEILEDIKPGKHTVKLVLEGYEDNNRSVTVASGKREDLSRTLTAKAAPVPENTYAQNATATAATAPVQEQPSTPATTGTVAGHQWVDLGLSVKWATTNVGASSPEAYGSYFAWGETSPKSDYSWGAYKFRISGDSYDNVTFTKYNTDSKYGAVDQKKRLEKSDDAARANWGGTWRMPTEGEFDELKSKCTWTWTTQGGKNGYKVTSKTNGNSIFLPAAACRYGSSLNSGGSNGLYWSSSLYTSFPCSAWGLYFSSSMVDAGGYGRGRGQSVRPVTE